MTSVQLFVPGRLCIMGEHTDWMARHDGVERGATIVCSTLEGLHADCFLQEAPQYAPWLGLVPHLLDWSSGPPTGRPSSVPWTPTS